MTGATENGAEDLLEVPIDWLAGEWHLVSLNYGPKGSALSIDGKLAAEGSGTLAVPSKVAALSVGSDLTGSDPAGGEFDEVSAFSRPLLPLLGEFYYGALNQRATLGPITADEEAAWMAAALKRHAEREAMMELMRSQQLTNSAVCITNVPVFLTNIICALDTNGIATVTFDILGGTNELVYEIFSTTNLLGSSITNSTWQREGQGYTCNTYQLTNQTSLSTFYVLGLPLDSDGDGLTDAYERLVSKTDPNNWNTADRGLRVFITRPRIGSTIP